jgi:hypothetical protein
MLWLSLSACSCTSSREKETRSLHPAIETKHNTPLDGRDVSSSARASNAFHDDQHCMERRNAQLHTKIHNIHSSQIPQWISVGSMTPSMLLATKVHFF